jgi:hypothetical protein
VRCAATIGAGLDQSCGRFIAADRRTPCNSDAAYYELLGSCQNGPALAFRNLAVAAYQANISRRRGTLIHRLSLKTNVFSKVM